MSSETSTRNQYFLIAGIILFSSGSEDGDGNIGSAPANAIVRHDNLNFPVHKLAKAQQNLHKSFVMKMPEEARAALIVHDIVVTNVSPLGYMTEEEFQHQPGIEEIVPSVAPAPELV